MKSYWILIILVIFSGYFFRNTPLTVDEIPHYDQIYALSHGNYTLNPDLTTIPGYHYSMMFASRIFGDSVQAIRFVNLLISLLAIFIYYKIAAKIDNKNSRIKTMQFVFLPLLFPFFFLIYTDVYSLLFVLLSFYFALNSRTGWAAIFSFLSILVRQNNVLWAGFIFVFFS